MAGLTAPTDVVAEPFVRHQLDPSTVRRAWVAERAGVSGVERAALWVAEIVWHDRGRMRVGHGVGPADLLATMLAPAAEAAGGVDRVSVSDGAETSLPPGWAQVSTNRWHWMLTDVVPTAPVDPRLVDLGPLDGPVPGHEPDGESDGVAAEVRAVLDAGNPGSFARPGTTPGVARWLGLREDGELRAVGALVRQPDGSGHLRAVTVHPDHAGRGLGRALSVALTRAGLAMAPVVSLGVYLDNAPALRIYRDLGYTTRHTFASGLTAASAVPPVAQRAGTDRSSTSADSPSR
ncbi:N-alpha-acetyltransferase RimI [Nocardioides aquaticus]|uniref:N-alpha-acetyltransferase RimI n=1 Tax=Nocardioides aquaticus TaxID=160826 RepID=A0ABX8EF73_9ACTN|nr:N-alpha-acetyltransferase RimI [Nocardioides aquaticus]